MLRTEDTEGKLGMGDEEDGRNWLIPVVDSEGIDEIDDIESLLCW